MKIIVVCGKVCSGKDTFAQNLAFHTHIDIGSIVRDLVKKEERVFDQSLDKQIIVELEKCIESNKQCVITGIRQKSILDNLLNNHKSIEIIWLEVAEEELKRRFLQRDNDKDKNLSFEEVLERDNQLGLRELELYIKSLPQINIINN